MIEIRGKLIQTPILDILYELRRDLLMRGIDRLGDIIPKGDYALITCPIHKAGQESHPSCGIQLEDTSGVKVGSVHCFTCGYISTLAKFVSDCFDSTNIRVGEDWLLSHCQTAYLTNKREIKRITLDRPVKEITYVTEEELKGYRYYHPYMYKRGLTNDIINKFDIGFDKKTNCVTFPVYDKNNHCLFVVKRSVSFKKFYIPKGIEKGIFGINQISRDCNQIVVCESVFNALTAYKYGYSAIALFGTGSKEQYKLLEELNVRRFILAFDGDDAGRMGAERFKRNIKDKLILDLIVPKGKDLNDLTESEFKSLFDSI